MDNGPEKNRILYDILYVVFKRKVALTILCMVSFVLIMFATFLATPMYKGTAKILIRSNPQQQLILFKDLATPGREAATVNPASNLIQILSAQQMARQVVERFRLDERSRMRAEAPEDFRAFIKGFIIRILAYPITLVRGLLGIETEPTNYFAGAVEDFIKESEDIQLEEETNVINLSVWEETPELSSEIANYMTQLLIERSNTLEQEDAKKAYDFTKEQVASAERALTESEDELLRFREQNSIISLKEQEKAKLDALHMVETQYIDVKTEFSEAQARQEEMRRKISVQKKLLAESPIFANNPVMKELISSLNLAEIELAGELEKFTESSESVRSLRAQASEGRARIEKELKAITQSDSAILQSVHPDLSKEYAGLTTRVVALAAKKDALEKEMEALRAQAFSLSVIEAKLDRLNRRKETNESLYKNLLDKYSELGVQQVFQMSGYDLKIVDQAFVPKDARPDYPKWILVIPLAIMGSLLLSFGAVFFVEYWDESFKSPSEIEDRLALPVLCTVPNME